MGAEWISEGLKRTWGLTYIASSSDRLMLHAVVPQAVMQSLGISSSHPRNLQRLSGLPWSAPRPSTPRGFIGWNGTRLQASWRSSGCLGFSALMGRHTSVTDARLSPVLGSRGVSPSACRLDIRSTVRYPGGTHGQMELYLEKGGINKVSSSEAVEEFMISGGDFGWGTAAKRVSR